MFSTVDGSTLVARFFERNRSVVFVGAATAFSLLGDQALYAVLPVYYESLGLKALEVGILLSANRWIRLLTNDLAHRLAAQPGFGQKALFVGAFGLGAATTLVYGLTASFTWLLLARLAWGLAWSFIRHLGVQAVAVVEDAQVVAMGGELRTQATERAQFPGATQQSCAVQGAEDARPRNQRAAQLATATVVT